MLRGGTKHIIWDWNGTLFADQRENWTRFFSVNPTSATQLLAETPPNEERAGRNFWSVDGNERKYRQFEESLLGVKAAT